MIYLLTLGIIIADQITKYFIINNIPFGYSIPICPNFNLVYVLNKGVSFSFLTSENHLMPWILSGFALSVCIGIVLWMRREKDFGILSGLSLILGGAIGNVIDRVRMGAVVDFLDFYIGNYHWPAFNVADSAICIGVFIILWQSFKNRERK